MSTVSFNALKNKADVIEELELTAVTKETKPQFFAEGSFLNRSEDFTGIRSLKNTNAVTLKNNIFAEENTVMRVEVRGCDQTRLTVGQTCGSEEELKAFLATNQLAIGALTNFIDFQQVRIGEDPVEQQLFAVH